MTKLEREAKRVSTLQKAYQVIPAINDIITKAEPFIRAYQKALKNYWENGKNITEWKNELYEMKLTINDSNFSDDRELDHWNYNLLELNNNYKQLLKI